MSRYVVAVYNTNRAYGGAEEGGWWFDTGELVRVMRVFKSQERAYDYCRRLNRKLSGPDREWSGGLNVRLGNREPGSMACDGWLAAQVYDNNAPAFFPERRPHYE
jgi:hypothetical protein